jgi:hypothetical protein
MKYLVVLKLCCWWLLYHNGCLIYFNVDLIMYNQDNRGCDYFKWIDMDICQYGKRVVSKLFDMHENLKNERAQIGTTISNEILKCKLEVAEYKAKMEVASLNFEMQLQMQKNKFNSKETKYRFALACLLILLVVMMFYPVSNANSSRLRLH